MENYENLGTIGEGTYGTVFKARHKITGQLVAIKKFKESDEDEQVRKTALREIRVLKQLRHDNVVNLLEVFRRKGKLYLVFEHVERNILQDLESHPHGLDSMDVKKYIYQLFRALEYCHSHQIIHRDIKPENLLISRHGVVKLCDFGFARLMARPGSKYTEYVATRWYRSPELLVGDAEYTKAVDIWAAGCMFAEVLTGMPLFPGESDLDQLHQIIRTFGKLPPRQMEAFAKNPLYVGVKLPEPEKEELEPLERRLPLIDRDAMQLLKNCLKYSPEDRYECWEVLQSPYFAGYSTWFESEYKSWVQADADDQKREADTAAAASAHNSTAAPQHPAPAAAAAAASSNHSHHHSQMPPNATEQHTAAPVPAPAPVPLASSNSAFSVVSNSVPLSNAAIVPVGPAPVPQAPQASSLHGTMVQPNLLSLNLAAIPNALANLPLKRKQKKKSINIGEGGEQRSYRFREQDRNDASPLNTDRIVDSTDEHPAGHSISTVNLSINLGAMSLDNTVARHRHATINPQQHRERMTARASNDEHDEPHQRSQAMQHLPSLRGSSPRVISPRAHRSVALPSLTGNNNHNDNEHERRLPGRQIGQMLAQYDAMPSDRGGMPALHNKFTDWSGGVVFRGEERGAVRKSNISALVEGSSLGGGGGGGFRFRAKPNVTGVNGSFDTVTSSSVDPISPRRVVAGPARTKTHFLQPQNAKFPLPPAPLTVMPSGAIPPRRM